MKVLVDQMYQNIFLHLGKLGRDEVHSVKDMVEKKHMPIASDYSVLKYAEKNRMVLITEDGENRVGCEENNIPCISLGQNPDINLVLAELEKIRALQA